MKKFSILIAALLGLTLTACEDVPAPYEVIFNDDTNPDFEGAILPYTSANLSAGFEIYTPSDYPSIASWSTGSSYVQITGYVDADGDGTKEYNYTQSWLISPALYTATTESLVLNFDYTIRYANSMNAAELAANHKVLVSKDYDGDVALATWKELNFKPKASPYSDWTLYGSGDIEIPAEYQNCDNVHVAFYYQVTDLKKVSTWELQNLMIYAGIPEETPDEPVDTGETREMPWTSASLNDFKAVTVKGIDWSLGSTYAKASGYVNSSYTETDAWLVSPAINTKTSSGVVIDVQHVIRYTNSAADLANHTMWASTDYDGDVSKATWTKLNYKPEASPTNTWDFYPAKTVGLPEALLNKDKVYIAYRYQCTSERASTWELKEFSIKEGTAPIVDDPQPGTPAEEITIGEFLSKADPNTTYRLTGKVSNITNTQYGNFDLVDATGTIYVYGLLDKDGNAKNFESLGIKEGDEITVEGKYNEYNGNPQIKNAQYISGGSGSGGGDDPGTVPSGEYITLSFTDNVFGIDTEKQTAAKTYTYEGYTITLTPAGEGNSFYYNSKDKYVILGKQDATLEFNGFDFAVSAIEITGREAASASIVQNIFVGETAVSTQTTGAKGTNVYNIASDYQAAGTHYTLKVLSNHNTQITEVKVYKAQ